MREVKPTGGRWVRAGMVLVAAVLLLTFWGLLEVSVAVHPSFASNVATGADLRAETVSESEVSPYSAAVRNLIDRGIMRGFGDGTVRPNEPVTRQQFAKMIVLTLGYPVSENDVCPFLDVPAASTGTPVDLEDALYPDHYVAVCAAYGITRGLTADTFAPHAEITRAQLITMVARAAGLVDPGTDYAPPFSDFSSDHYRWARRAAAAGLLDGLEGIGWDYDFFSPATRGECAQILSNLVPPTSAAEVERITKILSDVLARYAIPGGVIEVWRPEGEQLTVALGQADVANGIAMPVDNPFRAGNITKMFVSAVVLRLAEEGRLALGDTLSHFIPEYPASETITIRQLLNHTSGVYDYTRDAEFRRVLAGDPLRYWAPEELTAIAANHAPVFDPGTGWEYSNTNYILLGMVVEQVTGNGLADEISKRISVPLGLTDTYLAQTPGDATGVVHGYSNIDGDAALEDVTALDPSVAWASGAIVTTPRDLSVFIRALVEGRLLGPDATRSMMTWVDYGPERVPAEAYGLGISRVGDLVGHSGSIGGFESAGYYLPAEGVVVVAWVNRYPTDAAAEILVRAAGEALFPADFGP